MKKTAFIILFLTPFVLAATGYILAGEGCLDSLYGAITLYTMSPYMDDKNIYIEISRWLAPVMLASGLLLTIKRTMQKIKCVVLRIMKPDKATAVYGDSRHCETVCNNLECGIRSENKRVEWVKHHILMFDNDMDSVEFYNENKDKFKGKIVYAMLSTINPLQLEVCNSEDLRFFNINEIIARSYWKDKNTSLIEFYKEKGQELNIAIIGFGELGKKLYEQAVLNNLFSTKQRFIYHIWGDTGIYESLHSDFKMMNRDEVIFHREDYRQQLNYIVQNMDRVIITEEKNIELLTALTEINFDNKVQIHYYSPENNELERLYNGRIVGFGLYKDNLTEENIKTDELYKAAMLLNHNYNVEHNKDYEYYRQEETNKEALKRAKKDWSELDNFVKGSNIAAADYNYIRESLKTPNSGLLAIGEEKNELEHIRWCRYHLLNHWRWGERPANEPSEGRYKNEKKRIHEDLVPYSKLPKTEQEKDANAIDSLKRG